MAPFPWLPGARPSPPHGPHPLRRPWAGLGSLIALLSMTASAASIGPLCLCYALIMVGTRFFPTVPMINPVNWLQTLTPGLLLALPLAGLAMALLLRREVKAHV